MEELRLPWNNKEGLVYGGVIAAITGFIMMTFNICKTKGGIESEYITDAIVALPLLWVVIMILMTFVVGRFSDFMLRRYTSPSDSVNSKIALNIICCVSAMSVIMTGVGPLVGSLLAGMINLEGFQNWPINWPVNFCVAFMVEMIIAQPIARHIMKHKHMRMIRMSSTEGVPNE